MLKFKKTIIITIISISIMIAKSFAYEYDFNSSCSYLFLWDLELNEQDKYDLVFNKTSWRNVRSLTENFCQKAYNLKCSDNRGWEYEINYFDASQSVFLSILCNSVWEWANYIGNNNEYLKKNSFLDFHIISSATWYMEPCHSWWSMNSCDYSYNLPLIFNKIMDDFFWIKQARNLWITGLVDDFSAATVANTFSLENFPWLWLQEWLSKWICDPKSEYYRTTCTTLKSYMVDANNLLKNTEVINVTWLQANYWADCMNKTGLMNNILYCGLLWSNSDYKFINTVYNEYIWYVLFLSYYSFYIDGSEFLDDTTISVSDRIQENKEKIFLTQSQIFKSKQAITSSLNTLWEIAYSFPIHIWFLMYQEDAKLFMKAMWKVYTPIRTLYDKLRNVQIKES